MATKTKADRDDQRNQQMADVRQIEMLNVHRFRPHPRQQELVGDMRDGEFESLSSDILSNGVQVPLVVMADRSTIICGHQRWRAAKKIGLKQIPCIVRRDLADPDDPAVIRLLVSDNLVRRQLTLLQKARHAQALAEAEYRLRNEPAFRFRDHERQAVRDAVGRTLGCSGRNVGRYLAVLRAPTAIQEAFDAGLLTLVQAAGVASLPVDKQQSLAAKCKSIRASDAKNAGARLRELVQDAISAKSRSKQSTPPRNSRQEFHTRLRSIEAECKALLTGVDEFCLPSNECRNMDLCEFQRLQAVAIREERESAIAGLQSCAERLERIIHRIKNVAPGDPDEDPS